MPGWGLTRYMKLASAYVPMLGEACSMAAITWKQ